MSDEMPELIDLAVRVVNHAHHSQSDDETTSEAIQREAAVVSSDAGVVGQQSAIEEKARDIARQADV